MNHYVFKKLNLEQIQILQRKYENYIISNYTNNICLTIKKQLLKITCYNNGTCLLQGKEVNKEVEYIKKFLYLDEPSNINIDKSKEINNKKHVGSDEVGIGDVFGPIVVCSVLVTEKQIPFLKEIGIRDSKKISDSKIEKLFLMIKDKFDYYVKILTPCEFNIWIQKYNTKHIQALLHNQVILEIIKKIKENTIVVLDRFVNSKKYFQYLQNEQKIYKRIKFETKAESKYVSVALASVIARAVFLKEINKLKDEIGYKLLLGAGSKVDEQIYQMYQNNKELVFFQKIAKCNFKNIKKYFN
ncbi:MAG: ribonuclease HIII [Phytoplasma sp.]|uniref:ribonuclease HIII n=1 Tax=Phytoplasma sp. TaxID=2155 RepID=UPI002B412810|nr:ribonuclease HIII [Phytoplasma sp.]WRH06949.1 MAG: ribonuclease HIII [Phytoplasma sp.]